MKYYDFNNSYKKIKYDNIKQITRANNFSAQFYVQRFS